MTKIKIDEQERTAEIHYRLCPACGNYCSIAEKQIHCIVCGEKMLVECLGCKEPIIYPTAKHCYKCGTKYKGS